MGHLLSSAVVWIDQPLLTLHDPVSIGGLLNTAHFILHNLYMTHDIFLSLIFQGETVDSEHLSELTEEEYEVNYVKPHLKGFMKFDAKYLIPFFTRRFTQQV